MSLGNKRRVEEDLERIRRANLQPEELATEEKQAAIDKQEASERLKEFTAHDYLAMVIAALSIIVPYLLIFSGVMALLIFLFYKFFL